MKAPQITLLELLEQCRAMTWDGLNKATDQQLGHIATWDGHPMTDAAYGIIQRRNPPAPRQPLDRLKRTRTQEEIYQRPKRHKIADSPQKQSLHTAPFPPKIDSP